MKTVREKKNAGTLWIGLILGLGLLTSGCYTTFKSTRGAAVGETYEVPEAPAYTRDEAAIQETVPEEETWSAENEEPDYVYEEPSRTAVYSDDGDLIINNYYFQKPAYPTAFAWVYDPFYDPFFDIHVAVYTPLPVVVVTPWYDWYAPIWVTYAAPYYPGCFYPPLGVVYPVYPRFGIYFSWHDHVYYPAYHPYSGRPSHANHNFGRRTWDRRGNDPSGEDPGIRRRGRNTGTVVPGHRKVVRQPTEPRRHRTLITTGVRKPSSRRIGPERQPAPVRTVRRSQKVNETPAPAPRPRISRRANVAEKTRSPRPDVRQRPSEHKTNTHSLRRIVSTAAERVTRQVKTTSRSTTHRERQPHASRLHRSRKHGSSLFKKVFKTVLKAGSQISSKKHGGKSVRSSSTSKRKSIGKSGSRARIHRRNHR